MHHHKAPGRLREPSLLVLHLPLAEPAVPMPATGRFVLRPARLRQEERPGGVLASPGFKLLADGTGARHERDSTDAMLQTQAHGAATLGLTIRDKAADSRQPQG